jgi:hypothetical protein
MMGNVWRSFSDAVYLFVRMVAVIAVLIELYPALLGSIGLYPEDAAKEIADLAEVLLDEVFSALGD